MTSGRYWLSPFSNSSRDNPLCDDSESIWSAPSALARSPGAICLLGPLLTHELAASPWPFCWNWFSRSPRPPLSTSLRPPPPGRLAVTLPGNFGGAEGDDGAAPGWLPPKCLTAFQASSPRIAMVIGDIPPPSDCALGVLGPRGPFCMPLSTSSKPIAVSSHALAPPRNITVAHDGYKAHPEPPLRDHAL